LILLSGQNIFFISIFLTPWSSIGLSHLRVIHEHDISYSYDWPKIKRNRHT